ncbi:hypothetical protein ACE6H2_008195 [Prunus campanulata]
MLPTTSDLQVPVNSLCNSDKYGMGFDNITNTYKIVRVSCHEKDIKIQVAAEVFILGTSSWRELPSVPPCHLTRKSACAHGDMHWLGFFDPCGCFFIRRYEDMEIEKL